MYKIILFLSVLILVFFNIKSEIFAQSSHSPRSVKVFKFSPDEGETKNFYTIAGQVVEIENDVNGDVYVAASEVLLNGNINGDLLAVAGKIHIKGEVKGNLRVIAEKIIISGNIEKNMTVVGKTADILPGSRLYRGLIILGETVSISAPIDGQVKILAENVNLDDRIGSFAEIWVKNLNITSKAELTDLTYYSDNFADIDPKASISGQLVKGINNIFAGDPDFSGFRDSLNYYTQKGKVAIHLLSFIWAFLWGVVILRFFPKTLDSVTAEINKNFFKSTIVGFVSLIIIFVSILFLMITLIGIPLALFLIFILIIFSYLAKIYFSFWLGQKVIKNKKSIYLALALGLLIYYLLTYIKFYGGIAALIVLMAGLGSQIIGLKNQYTSLNKKGLI